MPFRFRKEAIVASCCVLLSINSYADSDHGKTGINLTGDSDKSIRADGHAPVGVMGEHLHRQGEWMLSYRYGYRDMAGNRAGETELSPERIIADTINRFSGIAGQAANLRIVPTKTVIDLHLFGAMFAPADWLTLIAMGVYIEKSMEHVTFNGAGSGRIGTFTTKSSGIGDSKIAALIRLYDAGNHRIHLNAGLSLPTGSNEKRGDVLLPNGSVKNTRLPYPMQLGSGTVDLLPGVTYTGTLNRLAWGAQYKGTFRTGNDAGYSLGNKQNISGWFSYLWRPWISTSARLSYAHTGRIDGIDPHIVGPVQTADPDNAGGDIVTLHLGINLAGQSGITRGHRLAAEAGIPIHRDLNGLQLETDLTVIAGWQYAF